MAGLRKVRLALSDRGKRGGARVLYVLFLRAETIYLAYVYTKGEFEDLPPEKRHAMKQIMTDIKKEFEP
ncbi:MAG: hypothetical protein QME60_03275 [Verrucomicrobiota bacterium]|nr:hypothetical protein [Verrucomicrobiota bacterium]